MVSASRDRTLKVWSVKNGNELITLRVCGTYFSSLALQRKDLVVIELNLKRYIPLTYLGGFPKPAVSSPCAILTK